MKIKINFYLFCSILYLNNFAFADETYVYCSDENKNWNWLSNGTVKVQGYWNTNTLRNGLYFDIFIIKNGLDEIVSLKNKCIEEFGANYIYAQPADNRFQRWSLFALNDSHFVTGIFTLR